jgi:aminoglycoside phosphotransferase (APT) family kinase protein
LAQRLGAPDLRVDELRRFVAGFSWETWGASCSWGGGAHQRRFVVRRVPECGLLDWYDVDLEWRVLRAMRAGGEVPMAESLWVDPDGLATGRPMMVVEHVEGSVPTPWNLSTQTTDPRDSAPLLHELARIGARIHATPLDSLPSELRGADRDDPAAEVDYWHEVYLRDRVEPVPALELAFAWLLKWRSVATARRALVHGDFRVGNFIVADGRIAAMLDWEGAHVGDPVEDLANCCLRLMGGGPATVGGVISVEEFLAVYSDEAGVEVSREAFRYWTVFGSLRSSITFLTAARRFREGLTDDIRFAALSHDLPVLERHLLKDLTEEVAHAG